jgi:hypothetical protein
MAIDAQITRLGPLALKSPEVVAILKRTNLTYPLSWLHRYLLLHFTQRGATRYGYTPRAGQPGSGRPWKGSYTQRKLQKYHHTYPLVNTGKGKASVLSGKRATSTRNGAKAIMPARVFNFRNPNSKVDMRAELTTVLDAEQTTLEADAQKKSDAEFARASK